MYDGLGFVTDFMNWIVSSSWKGVVVMLITNPLTMTIIAGLVFEGRMVKLWHGQSKSFFPGTCSSRLPPLWWLRQITG